MKKGKYFIILIGLLVLTGCSERELTFDRVYPDTTILEEAREKRQLEQQKEEENLAVTMKQKRIRPRSLELSSATDNMGYTAAAGQFCWAINIQECENIQLIYPHDNTTAYGTMYYLRVAVNEKIHMGLSLEEGPSIPYPARVEAYIYDENKNLHLHEAIDTPGRNFKLTVPSTPGNYIYLFKAYYIGNVEGISYHAHGIQVVSAQ